MANLPQWVCIPCGTGPFGALDYAICPKCNQPMTPQVERRDA